MSVDSPHPHIKINIPKWRCGSALSGSKYFKKDFITKSVRNWQGGGVRIEGSRDPVTCLVPAGVCKTWDTFFLPPLCSPWVL